MNDITKQIIENQIASYERELAWIEGTIAVQQTGLERNLREKSETERVIAELREDLEPHLPQRLPGVTTVLRDRF